MGDNFALIESVTEHTGQVYKDTLLGQMYPDYSNFESLSKEITNNIKDMSIDLDKAWNTFETNVKTSLDAAGLDMNAYKDVVAENTKEIVKNSKAIEKSSEELKEKVTEEYKKAAKAISDWEIAYA